MVACTTGVQTGTPPIITKCSHDECSFLIREYCSSGNPHAEFFATQAKLVRMQYVTLKKLPHCHDNVLIAQRWQCAAKREESSVGPVIAEACVSSGYGAS